MVTMAFYDLILTFISCHECLSVAGRGHVIKIGLKAGHVTTATRTSLRSGDDPAPVWSTLKKFAKN